MMSSKSEAQSTLLNIGFKQNHIDRAFSLYTRKFGEPNAYNLETMIEIIVRLQKKDQSTSTQAHSKFLSSQPPTPIKHKKQNLILSTSPTNTNNHSQSGQMLSPKSRYYQDEYGRIRHAISNNNSNPIPFAYDPNPKSLVIRLTPKQKHDHNGVDSNNPIVIDGHNQNQTPFPSLPPTLCSSDHSVVLCLHMLAMNEARHSLDNLV